MSIQGFRENYLYEENNISVSNVQNQPGPSLIIKRKNKLFTEKERDLIIDLYFNKQRPVSEIAEKLGRNRTSIMAKIRGIKKWDTELVDVNQVNKKFNRDEIERIKNLYFYKQRSISEIAEKLGRDRESIRKKINEIKKWDKGLVDLVLINNFNKALEKNSLNLQSNDNAKEVSTNKVQTDFTPVDQEVNIGQMELECDNQQPLEELNPISDWINNGSFAREYNYFFGEEAPWIQAS